MKCDGMSSGAGVSGAIHKECPCVFSGARTAQSVLIGRPTFLATASGNLPKTIDDGRFLVITKSTK